MLSEPEQIKQIFTAPPDVLHPGEGAQVLQPIVGDNSVILLDGGAHMEQRKLMLPAFHGERMERLTGLIERVAEARGRELGRSEPSSSSIPRMQRLTLEIILRAVFGLDPGERLDAMRAAALASCSRSATSRSPCSASRRSGSSRRSTGSGRWRASSTSASEIDALMFELIAERRAEPGDRDDVLAMLLEARHEDGSPMSEQELRDELLTLLVAGHETTATTLAWAFERLVREPAVLGRLVDEIDADDGDEYLTATIRETLRRRPVLPEQRAAAGRAADRGRRLALRARRLPGRQRLPRPPRPRRLPGSVRVPARALPRPEARHIQLDPVRRRAPALPRRQLRHARDADRAPGGARRLRPAARRRQRAEPARRRNITVRPAGGSTVGVATREARVPVAGMTPPAAAAEQGGAIERELSGVSRADLSHRLDRQRVGALVTFASVGFLIPIFLDPSEA